MAFQMDLTAEPLNLVVKNAYVRIEQVQHNRFDGVLRCLARAYQADPGFPPNQPAFKDIAFSVPYDLQGAGPYEQGYAGAKALEQFKGAVDC